MLKPKQKEMIEALLANPLLPNTEIAKLLNINRNTVAAWKKQPEFQEELNRRLKDIWEDGQRMAIENMQSLAREGNFQACKYILDSTGWGAPQKIELDTTTIKITIDE